tara:strand:+ start:305 stop:1297 length:993 start_codon:yes stop_codon:yes gene_type:complete
MNRKYIKKSNIDLTNPIFGTKIHSCSDEFFAPAKRLLNPEPPIFKENLFDNNGKWMDGWETRRRRSKGNDYVILKLGNPGKITLIDIDTTFFNGNQPEFVQIDGCFSNNIDSKNNKWKKITKKIKVQPNANNILKSITSKTFNYIRLNIFPDGGVARIRLFGKIDLSLKKFSNNQNIDLASIFNGSHIVACSDEHFGNSNNILLPGKSKNMGNGWETRRRRGKGYDWIIIKLGITGTPNFFEVNTHYFKGNYPNHFSIQCSMENKKQSLNSIVKNSKNWKIIVKKTNLKPNNSLKVKIRQRNINKINYIKLNIYPDGGISRFRVYGKVIY